MPDCDILHSKLCSVSLLLMRIGVLLARRSLCGCARRWRGVISLMLERGWLDVGSLGVICHSAAMLSVSNQDVNDVSDG